MFDFSKLADMSKLAKDAKKIQEKQELFQRNQADLLKKISVQLEEIIQILKKREA